MNSNRKLTLTLTLFLMISGSNAHAQWFNKLLKGAEKKIQEETSTQGTGLSAEDITEGLREALRVGAENATKKVSIQDGFFGDSLIKVLMPPDAKKVERKLRAFGQGALVDKMILSMNRAAEDASTKALEIFVNAIVHITIDDGLAILRGDKDAATQFLKSKTTQALTEAFEPVIKESLDKVRATEYWADVFGIYNKIPTVKKVNTDLPAYVTERALNGVFVYIATEEAKIRANPAARVTDLLKKVFAK